MTARPAAEALACAHAAGIVHRDMKPGNVLVNGDQVKITDFGIARAVNAVPVTRTGLVTGTPAYLSPEQVAGRAATPASDLYGLGVIAYECLTGRPPFQGNALAVALAHRDQPLPPLPGTVPGPVAKLVAALTAKDPQRRPGGALAVAQRARRILASPQVTQGERRPRHHRCIPHPPRTRTGGSQEPARPAPAQFGRRRSPPARRVGRLDRPVPLRRSPGRRHRHRPGQAPPDQAWCPSPHRRSTASPPQPPPGACTPSDCVPRPGPSPHRASLPALSSGSPPQVTSPPAPRSRSTWPPRCRRPRPPAGRHAPQRLPGRQPLSPPVMMFAVYACFRHGAAEVSWQVTSQTARYRDATARQASVAIRH